MNRFLLLTLLLTYECKTHAHTFLSSYQARQAWNERDYDKARQILEGDQVHHPENPEVNYNLGNVYYMTGEFEAAEQVFSRAIEASQDQEELRQQALFNRGNTRVAATQALLGVGWEERDIEQQILEEASQKVAGAIEDYAAVLKEQEGEGDRARTNRQYAQELYAAIEAKKKKQPEQEQQQEQEQQKQQEQKKEQKPEKQSRKEKKQKKEKKEKHDPSPEKEWPRRRESSKSDANDRGAAGEDNKSAGVDQHPSDKQGGGNDRRERSLARAGTDNDGTLPRAQPGPSGGHPEGENNGGQGKTSTDHGGLGMLLNLLDEKEGEGVKTFLAGQVVKLTGALSPYYQGKFQQN